MKKLEHILSCKSFDLNFETLAFINHYFMRKDSIVREFNNGKNIMEMEEIISIMKSFDYSGINKEELVVEISKFMSSLWLHQIFFDGNTRTVVAFINYFAKVYNIPFYYDYAGGGGISGALALTFFGEEEDFEKLNNIVSASICKDKLKKLNKNTF